jgi:uncharacterized protein (DUF58 family)
MTRDGSSRRWTRLGLAPPLGAVGLAGLAVITADSWLLLLAGAAIGLAVAAWILRPRLSGLTVRARYPARGTVGETVPFTLVVTNEGRRPSPLTRLTHQVAGLADVTVLVERMAPGGRSSIELQRPAVQRGAASSDTAQLASSEPFGLVETRRSLHADVAFVVHPALVPVSVPEARGQGRTDRAVVSRSGVDVHGVRDWRGGDESRQIHWRSTARRGRLVILEREEPAAAVLAVLVVGPAGRPSWEPLVATVASTAVAALRLGRPVVLVAAHGGPAPLATTDRMAVLDWCAALDRPQLPGGPDLVAALRSVGRGGELLVAATAAPAQWWQESEAVAAASGCGLRLLPLDPAAGGRP